MYCKQNTNTPMKTTYHEVSAKSQPTHSLCCSSYPCVLHFNPLFFTETSHSTSLSSKFFKIYDILVFTCSVFSTVHPAWLIGEGNSAGPCGKLTLPRMTQHQCQNLCPKQWNDHHRHSMNCYSTLFSVTTVYYPWEIMPKQRSSTFWLAWFQA